MGEKMDAFFELLAKLLQFFLEIPGPVWKRIKPYLGWLVILAILFICAVRLSIINRREVPKVSYSIQSDKLLLKINLKGQEDNNVWIKIHPQLVVRYEYEGNIIYVLHIYLSDYLEKESGCFENGSLSLDIRNKMRGEELCEYVRNKLRIRSAAYLDEDNFSVSISFVGGIRYLSDTGDVEEKVCILERDALIFSTKMNNPEIKSRLQEGALELDSNEWTVVDDYIESALKKLEEVTK